LPWYSNRKTYYQLGKSLVAFFREPIRYLKTSMSIESELEKPYLEDSYNDLHFSWLLPTWEWNWPGFGGGLGSSRCTVVNSDFCQTWARVTIDPEIHNVALAGGWGNNSFGASLSCGKGARGCALQGEEPAPVFVEGIGGPGAPQGWVKHESSDTCTEDFDVEYMFAWKESNLCSGGVIDRTCKGKFRVLCNLCALADPLAWVTIPETVDPNDQDVEITVSGGAANYTWTVNGDAHFDESITVGTTSYLDVDSDACGILSVRVGNRCGDYLDFDIRVTGSVWCEDASDKECHGASGDGSWQSGRQYSWTGGKWQILEAYVINAYGNHWCGAGSNCNGYTPVDCDATCDSVGSCDSSEGCNFCLAMSDAKKIFMSSATACAEISGLCCQTDGSPFCTATCWCVGGRTTYEWKCSC